MDCIHIFSLYCEFYDPFRICDISIFHGMLDFLCCIHSGDTRTCRGSIVHWWFVSVSAIVSSMNFITGRIQFNIAPASRKGPFTSSDYDVAATSLPNLICCLVLYCYTECLWLWLQLILLSLGNRFATHLRLLYMILWWTGMAIGVLGAMSQMRRCCWM